MRVVSLRVGESDYERWVEMAWDEGKALGTWLRERVLMGEVASGSGGIAEGDRDAGWGRGMGEDSGGDRRNGEALPVQVLSGEGDVEARAGAEEGPEEVDAGCSGGG